MTMMIPILAYVLMMFLTLYSFTNIFNNKDIGHFKLAVTFFVLSFFSIIVMTHIIVKNRIEIKELLQRE